MRAPRKPVSSQATSLYPLSSLDDMALALMNFLASQYGKEALRAAYKAWEANESAEALWPQMAQMAIAQPQALLMPPAPAPAPASAPAPAPAEEPQQEQPAAAVQQEPQVHGFRLVSDEKIFAAGQAIRDGHLRSSIKTVSWNEGSKHYPYSEKPLEIIELLRAQADRSATRELLMRELKGWCWDTEKGNPKTLSHFLREMVKQGIVEKF